MENQIKKFIYTRVKDKNGVPKDKIFKFIEGGAIHKKLLDMGVKIELFYIVE